MGGERAPGTHCLRMHVVEWFLLGTGRMPHPVGGTYGRDLVSLPRRV